MKTTTRLMHAGRRPAKNKGIVNPPVYHASTVVFPTYEALLDTKRPQYGKVVYGRRGTPTTLPLEDALTEIEGGVGTQLFPSGVAAITTVLLALLETGDHVLITDSAYGPTRSFAKGLLKRLGIDHTFYDPLIGGGLADLIRPNTKVVFVEAPGSLTFEMQDVPAIAAAAHAAGAVVVMDNTWATPLYCRAFALGVDVAVYAGTKYLVGHSDAMVGYATAATEALHDKIWRTTGDLGLHLAPDDAYLAQRGLRTLAVRLERHSASALEVAHWLKTRPEVRRVLHPALPEDPGHAIWQRDFSGASGLFAFIMDPADTPALSRMLDSMALFAMGYSWGGYESLILPADVRSSRDATPWTEDGQLIRLNIGLEDPGDLIADLAAGFDRLKET